MKFISPREVVLNTPEFRNARVADLGCGVGYFLNPLLDVAHEVVGVDINPTFLKTALKARSDQKQKLRLMHADVANQGGMPIKNNSIDTALISNVLFQVRHRDSFVKETQRILRSSGKALVIEWEDSFSGIGPHSDHVLTYSACKDLFESQGFIFERDLGAVTGAYHYGLVFGC